MPAKSIAQRRLMAMALNDPESISSDNSGVLGMSKNSLEDFASTKEVGLPKKVKGLRTRKPKNALISGLGTLKGLANTRKRTF